MNNNQDTTIDNAHLYCIYTMLYVNDMACNYTNIIKECIPQEDKEAKKIFGALEKRCNRYLRAINEICESGEVFYADYNSEIDDLISEDIEKYKNEIKVAYSKEEQPNIEYFTRIEMARTFIELSIVVIDDLISALKEKELPQGNMKSYKLLELKSIINDFAKWAYRKVKDEIDFNEISGVTNALDSLTKKLCDYKNFEKAYEYAVAMEKKDNSSNK